MTVNEQNLLLGIACDTLNERFYRPFLKWLISKDKHESERLFGEMIAFLEQYEFPEDKLIQFEKAYMLEKEGKGSLEIAIGFFGLEITNRCPGIEFDHLNRIGFRFHHRFEISRLS